MLTGNQPPGTMKWSFDSYPYLQGYQGHGNIRINYYFPDGTQGPEHPSPGQRYYGTSRTAYLPDCPEGREVLHLLKRAFDARLTFTIGTSVTTGMRNLVVWNDVHHKTSIQGGSTWYVAFIFTSEHENTHFSFHLRADHHLQSLLDMFGIVAFMQTACSKNCCTTKIDPKFQIFVILLKEK